MRQNFKKAAAFYNQQGKIDINEWNSVFHSGFSLADYNAIISRDMPFDTSLTVELMGGKQSKSELRGTIKLGHQVFFAEGLYLYYSQTNPDNSFLGIHEVRIDPRDSYPHYKGIGIGKIFLSNCVHLCQTLGISKIKLTAGRENGALFWARHGFNIETPTSFFEAEKNYIRIKDQLPLDVQTTIESAFNQAREDKIYDRPSSANRALASLDAILDGVPVREILYRGVEYRAILDLNDADQLVAFQHSMKNIDIIRWNAQKVSENVSSLQERRPATIQPKI